MKRGLLRGKGAWILFYLSAAGCAMSLPAVPAWTVDVSGTALFQKAAAIGESDERRIVFLDNARLAIAVLFRSLPDLRSGPNFRDNIQSNAAVFLLNSKTGAVESSRSWDGMVGEAAASDKLELVPVVGGALLCVGRQLVRLSSSLALEAERDLPLNGDQRVSRPLRDQWVVLANPQTDSALLIRFPAGQRAAEDHWINVRTLKDVVVTAAPAYNFPGMALVGAEVVYTTRPGDDYIKEAMGAMRNGKLIAESPVMIRGTTGVSRRLCGSCAGAVETTFGKDLVLMSTGPQGAYLVADSSGKTKLTGRIQNQGPGEASGSTTVNRVAFMVSNRAKFDGKNLSAAERVVILDIDKSGPVLEFGWQEESKRIGARITRLEAPKLALSPDGKHLAVLTGSTVCAYQVP